MMVVFLHPGVGPGMGPSVRARVVVLCMRARVCMMSGMCANVHFWFGNRFRNWGRSSDDRCDECEDGNETSK